MTLHEVLMEEMQLSLCLHHSSDQLLCQSFTCGQSQKPEVGEGQEEQVR